MEEAVRTRFEQAMADVMRDLKESNQSHDSNVMSPFPHATPFAILEFSTLSPSAHVSSSQSAHVSSPPISPAPPVIPPSATTPLKPFNSSLIDLLSHESPFPPSATGIPIHSSMSLFGRKSFTPPALSQFNRVCFRPWLDLFTEFLERFRLEHYLFPQHAALRDALGFLPSAPLGGRSDSVRASTDYDFILSS